MTCSIRWFESFFLQEPRVPSVSMVIPFPSATLILSVQPLGLVLKQHFFTGTLENGHSERCAKTAVSDNNSRDVTPNYLPKQQLLSDHFRTLPVHLQMLTDVADNCHAHDS